MKGNGNKYKAGVLLGGRQYTITLTRELDMNLRAFAQLNNTTPNQYIQHLCEWSIIRATQEFSLAVAICQLQPSGLG